MNDISNSMTSNNSADLVLFSVILIVPHDEQNPYPSVLERFAPKLDREGLHHFDFGTVKIEVHGTSRRQELFEAASARFLALLLEAGIDHEFMMRTNSYVRLLISLTAVEGQAGILIKPEMLNQWRNFKPYIAIDA